MKNQLPLLVISAVLTGALGNLLAESTDADRGAGIAAGFPGDEGIETHPAVVFVEGFEGTLPEIQGRYEDVSGGDKMAISDDLPPESAGQQSLMMSHIGGGKDALHLYRRLLPGYDKLHLRYYVKFDPDSWPIHHFVWLGGHNPSTAWPWPRAGVRPEGHERFSTGVETMGTDWRWDFYTYWMEMRTNPTGRYWGNDFVNDPAHEVKKGEWICVEMMVKLNDPVTASNGEQAFWINGRLHEPASQVISHLGPGFPKGDWTWDSWHPDPDGEPFEGFRWRTDPDLNINYLWLELYLTGAPDGHISRIRFDHVVVATEYIGPIAPLP